jgi:hypothetical protein
MGAEPASVGVGIGEPAAFDSSIVTKGEAGEGAAAGDVPAGGDARAGAEDASIGDRTGRWDINAWSVRWWRRGPVSKSSSGGLTVDELGVSEELGVAAIGTTTNGN